MCTRYYIELKNRIVVDIVQEAAASPLIERFARAGAVLLTSGEVRPTDTVPVIASDRQGKRTVFPMKWGFRLSERSLLINARSETAAQKPVFRDAWAGHRCIVPASWYFEWEHRPGEDGKRGKAGTKYRIGTPDGSPVWLGGLYRIEDGLPVFTVLTREPTTELSRLHDRMPLILPEDRIGEWIRPDADPAGLLPFAVSGLAAEKAETGRERPA